MVANAVTALVLLSGVFLVVSLRLQLGSRISFNGYSIRSLSDSCSRSSVAAYRDMHLSAKQRKRKTIAEEEREISRSETSTSSITESTNEDIDSKNQIDSTDIDSSLRAKLKAEIATPFRKLRQFLYAGAGIAGVLGTVTSVPQLLLAVQGNTDKGSITDVVVNIAIDLGVLIGSVALWDRENSLQQKKIASFAGRELSLSAQLSSTEVTAREALLSRLPVEIQVNEYNETATRIVSIGDLQSKGGQHVIIVCGAEAFVRDAVISARIQGAVLFADKQTYVVPVVMREEQLEEGATRGFAAKESMMSAPYIGKPTQVSVWLRYLEQEVELATKQGAAGAQDRGLVLAVSKTGKVVRRGIGMPPWTEVCEQLGK